MCVNADARVQATNVCEKCSKPSRKRLVGGVCSTCYNKAYWNAMTGRPETCGTCQRKVPKTVKGDCRQCYNRKYREDLQANPGITRAYRRQQRAKKPVQVVEVVADPVDANALTGAPGYIMFSGCSIKLPIETQAAILERYNVMNQSVVDIARDLELDRNTVQSIVERGIEMPAKSHKRFCRGCGSHVICDPCFVCLSRKKYEASRLMGVAS
jgi:hypothetical protein